MDRTSISDTSRYRDVCRMAYEDDNLFEGFKSDDIYKEILEHTSPEQGKKYYDEIEKFNPHLLEDDNIEKAIKNDMIGNPIKVFYENLYISPSTLRYLKVVSDLINLYGSLDNMDIVEIGVGYGGQALIICNFFNIKSYTLVDIDEVLKLSEKYLEYHDPETELKFYNQFQLPDKEYDLVISNYAFSECTKQTQDIYTKKILNMSKRGYMTNNNISHIFGVDSYDAKSLMEKINKQVTINQEIPLTHKDNYLLTW
jgi:putative sugar O-methyltransferase